MKPLPALLLTLAITHPATAQPAAATGVQIRNGNVFAELPGGAQSQITTDGAALEATRSRDGTLIAYLHHAPGTPPASPNTDDALDTISLCVVAEHACQTLVEPRYATEITQNLTGISTLRFSYQAGTGRDGRLIGSLFFLASAWATSAAVHRITLTPPPTLSFVTDSNSLEIVPSGKFAGALQINQHRYAAAPNIGACDIARIFDPNTKQILQTIPNEDCDAIHVR